MGRKFVRVSLGGVHDEAEIRGHRRTYIGALPGNIIQAIRKAGARNCVMMLDEIDKLGAGVQGDPSSALLEVLDPEQNSTFRDNYLGVPFDLSRVVFIATANMLDTIPGPLRDRMEIISLAGYTEEEKLQIARRYLRARASWRRTALTPAQVDDRPTRRCATIIRDYTREAGVRNLEREIGRCCATPRCGSPRARRDAVVIGAEDLAEILGPPPVRERGRDAHQRARASRPASPGRRSAATSCSSRPPASPGNGKLILTGQLGDVMKESAQAALSLVKSRARDARHRPGSRSTSSDIHVHVPAGATPKDGPSAGVAMFMALASLLTGRTVRSDTAMTGEISLRGLVLPVGGIKEKVDRRRRAPGIKRVMLPARNRRDFEDIPEEAREAAGVRLARTGRRRVQFRTASSILATMRRTGGGLKRDTLGSSCPAFP